MKIKFYVVFFIAYLLLPASRAFSQTGTYGNSILTERPSTPIDSMINGFIEILPSEYASNPSKKYPLLVFFEGTNQSGNGSSVELAKLYGQNEGMLPDIVRNNQLPGDATGNNDFTVGGTTYHFIMIIPQVRQQVKNRQPDFQQKASPTEVNDVINYAMQNYRVDVNRVYLSGLSLGGGSVINYAGQSSSYGNRLAAMATFSAASDLWENHSRVTNIAAANVPLWFFEVSGDHPYDTTGQRYIDSLNLHPEYTAQSLITAFTGGGHNSWEAPLKGESTGNVTYPNLYKWMLQKTRSLSQPVFATVSAGSDQTLNLSNGSMVLSTNGISFTGATGTLNGTATAGGSPIASYQWLKVGGNGGTITSPNSLSTTVTNLKPGSNTYQLRVTDNQGLTAVSNIKITVNAPSENKYLKVEAEAYTNRNAGGDYASPTIETSYEDQGPANGLGFWDAGRWAEYTINPLSAGTYALYYRYISQYGNPSIQIISGTTTITRSLVSDGTWRSDSIHIVLGANPTVRFLSQSSSAGTTWNFNYFELAQISSAQAPLPIKFVYFNSQCKNGGVNLEWKTAQEVNCKNFAVQRNSDGVHWKEIASLPASNQSTGEQSYQFTDNTASGSGSLYRIVEYDLNGKTTISTIVKSNCSSKYELNVYPNPSSGNAVLNVNLEQATKITVLILDSKGALMQQSQMMLPAGNTTLPLNMSNFAEGVYTINVNYNSQIKSIKIIKK